MKPIIVIKLRPVSYAKLINLGNRIIASMTGNASCYRTTGPCIESLIPDAD